MEQFSIELIKSLPKYIIQYTCIQYLDINSIKQVVKYYPGLFNEIQQKKLERMLRGFIYCCYNGYLEEAKLIYYSRNDIDVHMMEYAFKISNESGNNEISEWLYTLDIKKSDTNENYKFWKTSNNKLVGKDC